MQRKLNLHVSLSLLNFYVKLGIVAIVIQTDSGN